MDCIELADVKFSFFGLDFVAGISSQMLFMGFCFSDGFTNPSPMAKAYICLDNTRSQQVYGPEKLALVLVVLASILRMNVEIATEFVE